jgi:hypothetical protein
MANSNGWGDGAGNNAIGWGQGAVNNSISWGDSHKKSWAGLTDIVGLAYETEYTAVLNRATALGYSLPSESVRTKQNTLLASLKSTGVWAKLDVFYVFAQDGGADFGTLNWKNPNANQSTLVNAPTFVSNGGLMGNGTSSYIDTNFNPSTQGVQYTQNNASRYFFTHAISGVSALDGIMGSNNNRMIRTSVTSQRINSGALSLPTAFDYTATANTKSIHRTSLISVTCYNSTTGSTFVQSSAAVDNANQLVLRASINYGAHTCAAYAMGASMISEHTNFINDWNTYKNSL